MASVALASHQFPLELPPPLAGTALERARAIALRFAAKSPVVMKIGRDAFMRAVDTDYRRSVENAAESFALVASTEDCQEGLNAFVEKRAPKYTGRCG